MKLPVNTTEFRAVEVILKWREWYLSPNEDLESDEHDALIDALNALEEQLELEGLIEQ